MKKGSRQKDNDKYSSLDFFDTRESNDGKISLLFESQARKLGYKFIAGVDEVGRGALAGPVLAAAVILPVDISLIPKGIKDSKKLTKAKRESLFKKITDCAVSIGIGMVDNCEIDTTSILKATLKAMKKAVSGLTPQPDLVLVDGNQKFLSPIPQRTIIKGDNISLSIAAASIIAKVIRDKIMDSYHLIHDSYNFPKNKGYGTEDHFHNLKKHGCCPIHRVSYKGVLT
jgi:ribonuclease HII